ncbi:penicillin-binding protein activator, partial [Salmonella enterica subsp. enterica serovar Enteritidis]
NLNDAQRREHSLLAVEIKLAQKNVTGAQALLDKLKPADFAPNQQSRYWQAQIFASQGRPSLTLLRALNAQEQLLSSKDKQK